jgi:hypothetical protein
MGSSPGKVGLIAVLLVLAVVMARARAEHLAPHVSGTAGGVVLALIRGAGVAVLVAGVVLLVWGRRAVKAQVAVQGGRRKPMSEDQRRRTIIAAMVGVASALLYQLIMHALGPPSKNQPRPPPQGGPPVPTDGQSFFDQQQQHGMPEAGPGTYVMVALALITLALLGYALVRPPTVLDRDGDEFEEPVDDPVAVAHAVAAGRAAMADRTITDPREAVIACFAAMERALSGMGGAVCPRDADTPEEVLRRGIHGASLPEAPSRVLLSLFHRARFSTHAMYPKDRDAADDALGALLAALGQRSASGHGGDR